MIKPWIFEFFATPPALVERFDPAASQRFLAAYLDLWASAEPLGFEGIFFSEHHFGASYSPSPNLLIAAIAPRTKTMRLGVMGMVAAVSLAVAAGRGDRHARSSHRRAARDRYRRGIPQEMARVGMSVEEARAGNDEAVDIIDKALARAGDLPPRQVLEFRQSAADTAARAAAASAEMGDGGERGVGAQGGTARREDLHRLSSEAKDQ